MTFHRFRVMVVCLALAVLCAAGMAQGQESVLGTPVERAQWIRPDGKMQYVMGPRSDPAFNYQRDDGTWDACNDDWVQAGTKQVWKSIRGPHRIYADSTGAAIYAKGQHYLGTKTTHLIKFNKLDSTWVTLRAAAPESITVAGPEITFHDIFPGIDKTLLNRAKITGVYQEIFAFHQNARDSLAAWGPWTNRLLGTATRLGVDSLNLSWRDVAGLFAIESLGHMADDAVALEDGAATAFYIARSYLRPEGGGQTSVPVRKYFVKRGGSFWLVELFDPFAASALPTGTLYHEASFGNEVGGGTLQQLADYELGYKVAALYKSGLADALYMYHKQGTTVQTDSLVMALYEWSAGASLTQVTNGVTIYKQAAYVSTTARWTELAFTTRPTITAGTYYCIGAKGSDADNHYCYYNSGAASDSTYEEYETWTSDRDWDNPWAGAGYTGSKTFDFYCVYTGEYDFGHVPGGSKTARTIEDVIIWDSVQTEAWSGTITLMTLYAFSAAASAIHLERIALYNGAGTALLDSTPQLSLQYIEGADWYFADTEIDAALSPSTWYIIAVWANATIGNAYIYTDTATGQIVQADNLTYGAWPASLAADATTCTGCAAMVYGVVEVTPPEGGAKSRRHLELLKR